MKKVFKMENSSFRKGRAFFNTLKAQGFSPEWIYLFPRREGFFLVKKEISSFLLDMWGLVPTKIRPEEWLGLCSYIQERNRIFKKEKKI